MKDKLKTLVEESGKSVYKISKDTGISQTAIAGWLDGKYTPKLENLKILSEYFDVPLSYFIE